MNDDESMYDAAVRETMEECNINILKCNIIRELGKFPYLSNKDLQLYLVVVDEIPVTRCNSFFIDKNTNMEVPEMVDFKWIKFDEYPKYFSKKLIRVFDRVIPLVRLHLNK